MALALRTPRALVQSLRLSVDAVEGGLPLETMTRFLAKSGLELKDVYDIVIPARTLKHRRARQENLSLDESDKLSRLVRVFDQTVSTFGTVERARLWLTRPKQRFQDRSPLQMLRTDLGAQLVEALLVQFDEGMFA